MKKIRDFINKLIDIFERHETLILVIYKFFLDSVLILTICEFHGYNLDFVVYKYLIGWGLYVVLLRYIKNLQKNETFSNNIIFLLFILYFIPLISLYGIISLDNIFFLLSAIYMFLLLFLNDKVKYLKVKLPKKNYSKYFFNTLIVIAPLFIIFVSYKYTGLRLTLDLINVYGIRAEASKYEIPVIISYLMSFMKIIIPLLFVYCIKNKRYISGVWILFAQLVLFSFTAEKTIFLFIIVLLIAYFIYKPNYKRFLPAIFIFIYIFCLFEERILDTHYISAIVYARNFYLPPFISSEYFEFFKLHSFDLFGGSIMHWLGFNSVYLRDIPVVLGNAYELAATNLNNGLIGDAFSNFGTIGIVIMPFILVLIFRIMDAFTSKISRNIMFGFAVYYAIIFINGSWSTNLLSGGFLIATIFLYFMQKPEDKYEELNEATEFKLKNIITGLKKNYKKVIAIFIGSIVVTTGYIYITHKSSNNVDYVTFEVSKFDNDVKKYEYYSDLKSKMKSIHKEISEFINYFDIDIVNENDLNEFNQLYKELSTYSINAVLVSDDAKKTHYEYYYTIVEDLEEEKSKDEEEKKKVTTYKTIDNIEDFYKKIDTFYDYVNKISNELKTDKNINVRYNVKNNVMYNYNIEFVENEASISNRLILANTFIGLSVTILSAFYFYDFEGEEEVKKIKKKG